MYKEVEREAALLMTLSEAMAIFGGNFDDEDRKESATMADSLDALVARRITDGANRKLMYAAIGGLFLNAVIRSIHVVKAGPDIGTVEYHV
jgi:hypothetical protein